MSRLPLLHLTKGLRISPSKTFHDRSMNKTVLKPRNLTKLTLSHETNHEIESSKLFIIPKIKIVIISKSSRFGRRFTKMAWKTALPPQKKKQLNKRENNWNWTIAPDQWSQQNPGTNRLYQELTSAFFGRKISMFSVMLSSGNPETQHESGGCVPSILGWRKEICMYFCPGFFTESK